MAESIDSQLNHITQLPGDAIVNEEFSLEE